MLLLDSHTLLVKNTVSQGRGVFAGKNIPGGTVIADYLGKIIHPEAEDESAQNGIYGLCWREDFSILPDIPSAGAHIVNHSCQPNSTYYPYHGHILIVAVRKIFSGEEILTTYAIDPDVCVGTICTHHCLCATPLCRRTMHVSDQESTRFWDQFITAPITRLLLKSAVLSVKPAKPPIWLLKARLSSG